MNIFHFFRGKEETFALYLVYGDFFCGSWHATFIIVW
jgi:hypothetical protein